MAVKKDVSVIVLTYNSENTIKKCLDSIFNQTYKNFELIILDDGSTDNTIKMINSYKDSRIKIYRNNKNLGIAKSRNVALSKCNSRLIFFTDSDCIVTANWLETGVKKIGNNDIITGWLLYENEIPSFRDRAVWGKDMFYTSNLGFKKSSMDKVKGFDERFAMFTEDKDICYRILKNGGKKVYCPDMIVIHQTRFRDYNSEWKDYKNYYQGKFYGEITHHKEGSISWRIICPRDLIYIILPVLLIITRPFKYIHDFLLLPATWVGMIRGRLALWMTAIKERRFYI